VLGSQICLQLQTVIDNDFAAQHLRDQDAFEERLRPIAS
jgi:hypothetical protein